jgi:hypothetical protein
MERGSVFHREAGEYALDRESAVSSWTFLLR